MANVLQCIMAERVARDGRTGRVGQLRIVVRVAAC